MQRLLSPRRALWRGASLALLLAAMPLAQAQKASVTLARSSKPAPASLIPTPDVTSLSSVEQYVSALRAQAKKQSKHLDKDEKLRNKEAKEKSEHAAKAANGKSLHKSPYLVKTGNRKELEEKLEENAVAEYWEAYLYYLRPRVFPGTKLDMTAFARAAAQRDQMDKAGALKGLLTRAAPAAPTWSSFGPGGIANGAVSWRVSGLTYDPQNPNRYYAAGSRGGVWQTDDKGVTWKPIMDFQPMLPVSCIAVDIRDSNTIFIGTGEYDSPGPGFGILKGRFDTTTQQWNFAVKGAAQFGNTPIHRITTDPNTQSKLFAAVGNKGLFLSTDSGETWSQVVGPAPDIAGNPVVTGSFSNVVYNSTGDIIYACADGPGGGIFMSDFRSGGQKWVAVPGAPSPGGRIDIAASPVTTLRGRKTLYAVLAAEQQVWKGSPPGTNGAPPDDGDNGAQTWVQLGNFPKTAPGARSIWSQANGYNLAIGCTTTNDRVTVVDTNTPPRFGTVTRDVVIVAMLDLHISMDGGILWRSGVQGDIDYPYNAGFLNGVAWSVAQEVPGYHTDHHAITISPFTPFEFLTGCDGGVNRITFTPGNEPGGPPGGIHQQIPVPVPTIPGAPRNAVDTILYESANNIFRRLGTYTRAPINNQLSIAQAYFSGFHPTNPVVSIEGTQDNGTVYSFGSANTWNAVLGGDGGGCGINQFNPNIQFASIYHLKVLDPTNPPVYPVDRTANSWGLSSDVSLYTGSDVAAFFSTGASSRSNPNVFYMSTNYLYEYDERIQDWRKFRQQFSALGTVSAIGTTPASLKYLYVGTNDGLVWLSTNADQDPNPELVNFRRIDRQGLAGGLPQRAITGISVSALDPKIAFATVSGLGTPHVWRCNDTTVASPQWVSVSGNLPDIFTNCVEVLPRNNNNEIAVGTDVGAFYTSDGGATWHNISSSLNLPNVQVNTLTFIPGTNFLNAGTFGRGQWHIDLTNPLTVFNAGGSGGGPAPAPPPNVTLTPYLQDYTGSRSKLTLNVQAFQGTTLVLNTTKQLSAGGVITIKLPNIGTYDLLLTVPGFLHKRLTNLVIKTDVSYQPQLINGDVNRDNTVSNADLTAAMRHMNQFWTGAEDVNGDGRVNQTDLDIITKNLNKVGDN